MSGAKFQTVGNEADRIGQTVNQAASAAGAAVRDAASDVNRRLSRNAERAVSDIANRVEAQPITSLLVAGGIGLLAGMLLARR